MHNRRNVMHSALSPPLSPLSQVGECSYLVIRLSGFNDGMFRIWHYHRNSAASLHKWAVVTGYGTLVFCIMS